MINKEKELRKIAKEIVENDTGGLYLSKNWSTRLRIIASSIERENSSPLKKLLKKGKKRGDDKIICPILFNKAIKEGIGFGKKKEEQNFLCPIF